MAHFKNHPTARVAALFCNKPDAYALERARQNGIPAFAFSREQFRNGEVLNQLQQIAPDLIVLAGFLWLVPQNLLQAFPNRIINIHPALLPQYGGKGMHGRHVHAAVVESGEPESGITIHYINEEYDKGTFILQERCPVLPGDTPEDLAARVLQLEHRHLPLVVEQLLTEQDQQQKKD